MKKNSISKEIEYNFQKDCKKIKIFNVKEDKNKKKYYCLSMLPYPSGDLHIGHIRNYNIGDIISRYNRMLGKNVLQPIGWDAFGLPAERAAVLNNIAPANWTYANIYNMRKQLRCFGFGYDWSREIITCLPSYYCWEQWFFTYLYNKKLIYKIFSLVNWCKNDETVLANEQIMEGCCWRCDTPIEIIELMQWFINIKIYAEILLLDIDKLEYWPLQVRTMQKNWIGSSEGVEIILINSNLKLKSIIFSYTKLAIFFGITFIAESVKKILLKSSSSIEKLKVNLNILIKMEITYNKFFKYISAIEPLTLKEIKILLFKINKNIKKVTMYEIGVPGHEENSFNFAIRNKIEIKRVIRNNFLCNSNELNGLDLKAGFKIIKNLFVDNGLGNLKLNYKLKNWGVSRQRYWGTPIPMITLENGTIISSPAYNLPLLLPENIERYNFYSQLKTKRWINLFYNLKEGLREKDTLDTFIESSWYYARYACPRYKKNILNLLSIKYWLPIDVYIGGKEHAIMHLMYFRFLNKFLFKLNILFFKVFSLNGFSVIELVPSWSFKDHSAQ